jgi:hypothetical protein
MDSMVDLNNACPMRRFVYTLALWILLIPSIVLGGSLRFEKEKILIVVSDSEVQLTGEYYFRNPSPDTCRVTVQYPFVVLSSQPFPSFIRITDASDGRLVPHHTEREGVRFRLDMDPFGLRVIQANYRQKVLSKRFEYLLTTTASWGTGLQLAEFRIMLPSDCDMKACSLPYKKVQQEDGRMVYWIRQEDFLPKENLVIQWEKRHDK